VNQHTLQTIVQQRLIAPDGNIQQENNSAGAQTVVVITVSIVRPFQRPEKNVNEFSEISPATGGNEPISVLGKKYGNAKKRLCLIRSLEPVQPGWLQHNSVETLSELTYQKHI